MKRLAAWLCAFAMSSLAAPVAATPPEPPKDPKPPIARPMAKRSQALAGPKSTTTSKGSKKGEKTKGAKTREAERSTTTEKAKHRLSNASRAL